MQRIMESVFDIAYLVTAVTLGILILRVAAAKITQSGDFARKYRWITLFGLMTVLLGAGDAFHLVPRVYALNTDGIANHAAALGIGTLVTSITMTVFYVMLYHIWCMRNYIMSGNSLTFRVYALALVRIALCLFPQNNWTEAGGSYLWGIYRNVPFLILGLLMVLLFFKKRSDRPFRWMWLAVLLSFLFYIPVVLFADAIPVIGMLMLPKTCMYVWMMVMGYKAAKPELNIK